MKNPLSKILPRLREFFCLLAINLLTKWRSLVEFIKVAIRYYPNRTFLRLDLNLCLPYLFRSPYSISKRFLQDQGSEDIHTYGETPLTTLEQIAQEAELKADDVLFDLGCGPGRTSIWLHTFVGCRVIGIEQIPVFVQRAQSTVSRFDLTRIEFHQGDIRYADYSNASAVYLYGTCFNADFLEPLIERLRALKPGTKIITVSYELNEFTPEPYFELIKQFPARYTWGEAQVFVQKPVRNHEE
jgi:SAM-dependent methyltransferase